MTTNNGQNALNWNIWLRIGVSSQSF